MAYIYDTENIFAKILRGEIPNNTVLETEHSLAFHDIASQAPTHILVIPKGAYVTYDDFAANASDAEIIDYTRAIAKVCDGAGVSINGFRMITNAGRDGGQEVPHLHVHILSGKPLGPMLSASSA